MTSEDYTNSEGQKVGRIRRARRWTKNTTRRLASRLSPPDDISHWRNLTVLLVVTLTVCIYNWLVVINGAVGRLSETAAALIGFAVMVLALWVSVPAGAALKRYCKRQTLPHLIRVFTALCIFSLAQVAFLPGLLSNPTSTSLIKLIGTLVGAVQLAITGWLVKLPWDRSTEAVMASNENELIRKWDDPVV